jgi:hypothetical protein
MPFGNEGVEETLGLALSGGGFRATLFHIGSLWRLNEFGVLGKIDRISSISEGSIVPECWPKRGPGWNLRPAWQPRFRAPSSSRYGNSAGVTLTPLR